MSDPTEVLTPDQGSGADEVSKALRPHRAAAKSIHETCCGCVEFYWRCDGQPEGKLFHCTDYCRLPDIMPGPTGQPFPASRMGNREPRVRSQTADQERPAPRPRTQTKATIFPRGVRVCGCGAALLKGRRLCDECRAKSRQRSKRRYMRGYMEERRLAAVDAG